MKKFRINPKRGEYFFWAIVFDSHKDMYKWYDRYLRRAYGEIGDSHGKIGEAFDFSAIVMPYTRVKIDEDSSELQKDIGIALFNKEALGIGLIAHEMTHCALWFDRSINKNWNAEYGVHTCESEERLAYLIGDFTRCFVTKSIERNLFA